jgi:hypothetical protein
MEYLFKASVVITLMYLCFYIFLKKETFFEHNRWFLLSGLILALVFPLIVIPVYIPIETITIQETAFIQTLPSNFVTQTQPKAAFDWFKLIPILYGIGLSVFLIQFVLQFGSLVLLLLKNPKHKEKRFTYVIVNTKISPFSFFKWIVYNPESYKKEELQLILTHEKVHANQLHSIDILLTQAACAVFWFNPLIWLYRKEIRQNLEYIADSKTQSLSNSKKEYQHLLLKTSVANHNTILSNNFYNSSIKKRILMLNKSRSKQKNQLKYLLMLPLLAGLLISMNTEEVYIEAETTSTKDSITHESIKLKFTNQMNDDRLEEFKTLLKSKGVTMTIKRIKRNSKNEITAINIDFKTENKSTNYNVKDNTGIDSFYFEMNDNGNFGVSSIQDEDHLKEIYIIEETQEQQNLQNQIIDHDTLVVIVEDSTYFKSHNPKHKTYIKRLISSKNSKDTIYFTMDSLEIKSLTSTKSDFYYEDGSNLKIISEEITIHNPSNKAIYNTSHDLQNPKPLIIVEGKPATSEYLKSVNPDDIESMTVLKGKDAINAYGLKKGKNGVIIIKTKPNKTGTSNNAILDNQFPNENILYILDGKEISKSDLLKVYSKETVLSLNVLKGKEAKEKYGDKGANGAVEVISKNKNDATEGKTFIFTPDDESNEKASPLSISYSTTYIDTEDISKSASLVYISKSSQNHILEAQKTILEKQGILVKYSKLKRNKSGEIISIKISLNNEEGQKSSASYKNNYGIPNIEFGIVKNALVVRTSELELEGY